ncbi:MAG: GtrA family protein [Mycobacteriaceae bacterium]
MNAALPRQRDDDAPAAVRLRRTLRRWSRGGAELFRYAAVGIFCTILYSTLFWAFHGLGSVRSNVLSSAVSTVVGTELHRRVTFRRSQRVGFFTAQWQSFGLALLGLAATSAVLAGADALFGHSTTWQQLLLVNGTSALIGVARYVAMRNLVF